MLKVCHVLFYHHLVLHPTGQRDVAEIEAFLQDHRLLASRNRFVFTEIVALFHPEVLHEFVQGAAAGFLFGSFDALFHRALLGANFGARFRYDLALFGDSHFHARLHNVERQKCRSSGDEHRQENPQ